MNSESTIYQDLVNEYLARPRDVCTVPLDRRSPKWFFVYSEDGVLFVESGRHHANASSLKRRAKLSETQLDTMLDIYHRRQQGEAVTAEAQAATFQKVYWYGIFSDMGM